MMRKLVLMLLLCRPVLAESFDTLNRPFHAIGMLTTWGELQTNVFREGDFEWNPNGYDGPVAASFKTTEVSGVWCSRKNRWSLAARWSIRKHFSALRVTQARRGGMPMLSYAHRTVARMSGAVHRSGTYQMAHGPAAVAAFGVIDSRQDDAVPDSSRYRYLTLGPGYQFIRFSASRRLCVMVFSAISWGALHSDVFVYPPRRLEIELCGIVGFSRLPVKGLICLRWQCLNFRLGEWDGFETRTLDAKDTIWSFALGLGW